MSFYVYDILKHSHWTMGTDLFCCSITQSSLIDMTYIAVDNMRKDKGGNGGTIVNIASMAGT